ncbi:histidine kinase [Chryseobacterium sp. C39-AII1]|uniref:sensor histidine kinase n=1 Tax=Chryseobacterium sp. C39-AII1 TaxID=3080332 RepID=UPI00320A26C8
MNEKIKWQIEKYTYEIAFFIMVLLLVGLYEWIASNSFGYFFPSIFFFLIIYWQAQLYKFIVFPLFKSHKYFQVITITLVYLTILVLVFYIQYRFWLNREFHLGIRKSIKFMIYHVATCSITTIILMCLSLIKQFYQELEKRITAQQLLGEIKVKLLPAQLSPHFFFNMFNNLYGVSLTDPNRIPNLILKLSNLMRYPLENGDKPLVSIKEEVDYIESYIEMEKVRIGRCCQVIVILPQNKELFSLYYIAPLILITLVENAFKHSAGTIGNCFIKFQFELNAKEFSLKIWNSVPETIVNKESMGIGLSNIRKRLDLLYLDKYTFETFRSNKVFKTELTFKLNAL